MIWLKMHNFCGKISIRKRESMNIASLSFDSIAKLRQERSKIIKNMIDYQGGVLLVLGGAYVGEDRRINTSSYAILSVFFELWDRYTFDSWSYTFDEDGLMFYIRVDEDAVALKNTLVHYEDYHPLGFAISSQVFTDKSEVTREDLGIEVRKDFYFKKCVDSLLNDVHLDKDYRIAYTRKVDEQIIKGDKQTVLSNVLMYGLISAITKPMGFGMYGPNDSGYHSQINYERFLHLLRTYREESKRVFNLNANKPSELGRYIKDVETKIQLAVLNQQSYHHMIYLTSLVLFGFIMSRGYNDIQVQVKKITESYLAENPVLKDLERLDVAKTGYKEIFNYYVPFIQKHGSITSTFLYIMSRYHDDSVKIQNGEQNLLKVQFLAKNLVFKEDKWIELDRFNKSNQMYPHDATVVLAITCMLDVIQRNYLKIKMLFDVKE